MQTFDAAALRSALPFGTLIPALHAAFASHELTVPARHVHTLGQGSDHAGTVLVMPAWSGAYLGIKTINIFPGNGRRGLPGLHATYLLYDATNGVPLATMDGNEITARRTAAAAALGASFLARADARRLLVLGSGRIARLLPEAMRSVRPGIDAVRVWNHRPEGAEALAAQWRAEGLPARAATDLEAAVREADIVSCATLATAPLVRGAWLAPGTHLDLIGSFTPQMKEADAACFGGGARVCVDTDEALRKAGDLLDAIAAGALAPAGVHATLAQLCRGERRGRTDPHGRTVFKAVGSALEDLAAATLAWETRQA